MKLATYNDGSRDGQLLVVSRDLSQAHYAHGIAGRMQQLLDDWGFIAPQLEELYVGLNHGRLRHAFNFEPKRCLAPLPRAPQSVQGGACPRHQWLAVRAAGLEADDAQEAGPASEPWLESGAATLLGACAPARFASEALGLDFEAGLAVLSGDLAQGAGSQQALEAVRLLALTNSWRLRSLEAAERARGHGLLHSKPATAYGPVAVTPDELGAAWRGGRVELSVQSMWNGRKVGQCEAGGAMAFHFGQLMAQLARTQAVAAGTLIGSGVISPSDAGQGYSCIADKRAQEQLDGGAAKTAFMKFGDSIRIEIKGRDGLSVFGAIDQDVCPLHEEAESAASSAAP